MGGGRRGSALAVRGLVERDGALFEQVILGDGPLNSLHIEIDNRCFMLLALHQPMAADLRASSAVKINTIWNGSAIWP
jgi:phosphate uptake regulator